VAATVDPERLARVLELAYRYLNSRDRTVHEMRRHLARGGAGADEIDSAVQVLVDRGHLDDARFARLFAHDKCLLEQWGSDRIARTLLERGLERELVEAALEHAACESESELERAVALLQRRFPTPPRDRREQGRALGVLARKGYGAELAVQALAAHTRDAGAEPLPVADEQESPAVPARQVGSPG